MTNEFTAAQNQLRSMIVEALKKRYISTSSHMGYTTGNSYQTIDLDGLMVGGYREDRAELFSKFNFKGRRVLDCGCNLGELSRLARHRGAELVDGIEYDQFFAHMARLITAYKAIDRVSIKQGDLTKAETFDRHYDVTMAFSVFPYITPHMKLIADRTSEAMVLETHDATPNLKKIYVEPLAQLFPYYTLIERTDYGFGKGDRFVFMFAKREQTLTGDLLNSTVDIAGSDLHYLNNFMQAARTVVPGEQHIDFSAADQIVKSLDGTHSDVCKVTAGVRYWIDMIKGLREYQTQGSVTPDNTYAKTLRTVINEVKFDDALASKLQSDHALLTRVKARFDDAEEIFRAGERQPKVGAVRIFMKAVGESGKYQVKVGGSKIAVQCDLMDGYHRLFWAKLFKTRSIPGLFCYT